MPPKSNQSTTPSPQTLTTEVTVAFQNPTKSSAEISPNPIPPPPPSNACAACRFQRPKCAEDCPLAPHFPAHKHQQFINAYKLFGVNNIVNTLNSVAPWLRDDAMTALKYTADARAKDPVGGCARIIVSLYERIAFYNEQLEDVLAQIAAVRAIAVTNDDFKFEAFR
ncbi:LOB domain-containing protein 22-like [Chenopodium quinoa]|uniref:LOB domain-containing protein n=1 Tax=Chenopodium quinoa TaxID=63459 RepID=A0A803NCW7_CHEQI|nr:LOB domain-containing protein 22-like [Chenopodium quinoa]